MANKRHNVGFKVVTLLWTIIILFSCRKELENLNKQAWTPEIGIPLFYSKVTGSDIAYDWLKASSVVIDSSQVITVIYESKGKNVNLLDSMFFKPWKTNNILLGDIIIPFSTSSTFISFGKFSDDFTTRIRDSIWNNHGSTTMLPSLNNEKSLNNVLNGFSQLENVNFIHISSGILTLNVTNVLPYTFSAFIDIIDASGISIIDSPIYVQSLASGTVFSYQFNLINKRVTLPLKIEFYNIYAPEVFAMVDTANQGISIKLELSQTKLSGIKGQFQNLMIGATQFTIAPHPLFRLNVVDGELRMQPQCFSCVDIEFNITLPSVKANGQPLNFHATDKTNNRINVSNTQWIFPFPSTLPAEIKISSSSPNGLYYSRDTALFYLALDIKSLKSGSFMPAINELILVDTMPIPFFAKTQGNAEFMEPYMETNFINRLMCKVTASISNIINSNGDYLISPYVGQFIILDPAPMDNFTAQSFLFDVNNSNIKTFVNNQPDLAYSEHILIFDDTVKVSENNQSVEVVSSLALPFKGSVSGLIASDTTILQADILENTKEATLYITATNYFPLKTKVFILSASLPTDTIAVITIPPNTTQENRLITEVYLNEDAIQRLKGDKRVIITGIFDSPDGNPQITIKSSQYFEIHAGVKSRTVIEY